MKHLSIVVPYRNREQHLQEFITHVSAYFTRDKADRTIPYRVYIVEQTEEHPFNRGAMKNIGFLLGREASDYTCFHDIDYLPIWADYAWADTPTALVWFGAEIRPVAPGRSSRIARHNLDYFYGGAVLTPNKLFEKANGYSNDYWGWGYEDSDLQKRFAAIGVKFGRRKGTYKALLHDNESIRIEGGPTPIALVNKDLYEKKWAAGGDGGADGVGNIDFEILDRRAIPTDPADRAASWEKVTVRVKRPQPRSDQIGALNQPTQSQTAPPLVLSLSTTLKFPR